MEHRPTTYAGHAKAMLLLGLPLVGSFVAQFLIHMTDTLMLGWYDVTALAAATIATSIWFVVYILGCGFSNALMPLVAEAVESEDSVRIRRVTRMTLWLSMAYAVLGVAFLWNGEAVLATIGQTPAVSEQGGWYLRIACFGLIPALLVNSLRSYLSAQGLTAVQLWVTLASVGLNALVNYGLIFGNLGLPEMGIQGAAIASVIVQIVQFGFLAWYAEWKLPQNALFQRIWRPDWEAMGQVFRLGLPIGLTSLAEGGLFTGSSIMMGWIGEIELAAHGIALQLVSLAFMFHLGMSQAATIQAGGAYGRRDEALLRERAKVAFGISIAFGVLVVMIFVLLPEPLVSAFVDPADEDRDALIQVGVTLMVISALFQFVDAAQIIWLSVLRGVQDTTVPMWMAVVSYWVVGIPVSYLMAFTLDWGPIGLWLGLTVGLALAAVLLGWRFWARSVHISRTFPKTDGRARVERV